MYYLPGLTTDGVPPIINSGASVHISPCRADFITYDKCDITIKDLSLSHSVAGKGMIWKVVDSCGETVVLDIIGYHIPGIEVRLLSPQLLLQLVGGHHSATFTGNDAKKGFTSNGHKITLADGTELVGKFCSGGNLPLLTMSRGKLSTKSSAFNTFASTTASNRAYWATANVLDKANQNMSASKKEFHLWHCRLSHASYNWIQLLMRTRPWLRDLDTDAALHQGPFIPCTETRTHVVKCRHLNPLEDSAPRDDSQGATEPSEPSALVLR